MVSPTMRRAYVWRTQPRTFHARLLPATKPPPTSDPLGNSRSESTAFFSCESVCPEEKNCRYVLLMMMCVCRCGVVPWTEPSGQNTHDVCSPVMRALPQ